MGLAYGYLNLAPGHDNKSAMKPLWQWNNCLGVFDMYKSASGLIEIKWKYDEGRRASGSSRMKPTSLPNVHVIIQSLHIEGFKTIVGDILDDERIDNYVTCHVPVHPENRWGTFNGRMELPGEPDYTGAEYPNFEFDIFELIEI